MITTVASPAVHADTDPSKPVAVWSAAPVATASTQAAVTTAAAAPSPAVALAAPARTVAAAAAAPTPAILAPKPTALKTASLKGTQILHGLASWYGGVFDGRKTASGETYDKNALTACHPTLPFGSLVRVINRSNKKSVVVRINDRGDLGSGKRVIDLSWAAAHQLAMVESGVARVDLEVISKGPGEPAK